MKKALYLIIVLPLIFTSCSKNEDSIEITEEAIEGVWQVTKYDVEGSSLMCPSTITTDCVESWQIGFLSSSDIDASFFTTSYSSNTTYENGMVSYDSGTYMVMNGNLLHTTSSLDGENNYYTIESLTDSKITVSFTTDENSGNSLLEGVIEADKIP